MSTPEESIDNAEENTEDDSFWQQLGDAPSEPADWAGDELEEAYLRAMEVLEASDAQLPELTQVPNQDESEPQPGDLTTSAAQTGDTTRTQEIADLQASMRSEERAAQRIAPTELASELNELSQQAALRKQTSSEQPAAVLPRQILEALLFVGGEPLTTKRLNHVLRGFTAEFVESQLEELNALYAIEGRPYEIRFGDGGYRMCLREDFERIRRKVYGLGPKEVRLSQEVLEVLAIVAYHQPLTAAGVEELGKPGSAGVLRQLLRRELICVERTTERPREVSYRTTPRFLSLFGIRNLNELPRLEQISYK